MYRRPSGATAMPHGQAMPLASASALPVERSSRHTVPLRPSVIRSRRHCDGRCCAEPLVTISVLASRNSAAVGQFSFWPFT